MKKTLLIGIILVCMTISIYAADEEASSEIEQTQEVYLEADDSPAEESLDPIMGSIQALTSAEEPVVAEEPMVAVSRTSHSDYYRFIGPYSYNMLMIRGDVAGASANNSLFNLRIDTDTFSISNLEGAFSLRYLQEAQKDSYNILMYLENNYNLKRDDYRTDIALYFDYKNYLFDFGENLPLFIHSGLLTTTGTSNISMTYINNSLSLNGTLRPYVGVGIGRTYNISQLIYAKIMLQSLGLDTSQDSIIAVATIMAKEDQYMEKISSDFGQNYIRYYTALLEAIGMEGRHMDLLALSRSQMYRYERAKFDFARRGFTSQYMSHGWEVGLSARPFISYTALPSTFADFDIEQTELTLHEEYSHMLLDDKLYVKGEAEQILYIDPPSYSLTGLVKLDLRYFPTYSRLWFGFGLGNTTTMDLDDSSTLTNTLGMDISVNYLVTPNFVMYAQLDTTDFSVLEVNIGGELRLL